jgi:hypothetical protein
MTTGKTWDTVALRQLQQAYKESRVFLTAVELDLFSLLADTPLTATEVTVQRQTDLRATTDEIKEDLEHAGFSQVRALQFPEPTKGLVQATRR